MTVTNKTFHLKPKTGQEKQVPREPPIPWVPLAPELGGDTPVHMPSRLHPQVPGLEKPGSDGRAADACDGLPSLGCEWNEGRWV